MLLSEAKQILKKNEYNLSEASTITAEEIGEPGGRISPAFRKFLNELTIRCSECWPELGFRYFKENLPKCKALWNFVLLELEDDDHKPISLDDVMEYVGEIMWRYDDSLFPKM